MKRREFSWPEAHDLYRDLPLPFVRSLPVLGIPVRFSSNSRDVMQAVDESFGHHPRTRVTGRPITVRIVVYRGGELRGRAGLTWHIPDRRRALFHSAGSAGMLDLDRGDAFAFVTPALVADRPHFRYGVLEALTLTTVNDRDRSPIHAGAFVRGRSVLLLAGPSGVGKSTLVYAALREASRGGVGRPPLQFLTDDAIYVQTRPAMRIWGAPGRLYLRPETRRHFAEVGRYRSAVLSAGKTKLAVGVARGRIARVPLVPQRVGVVLLSRGRGPVSLARASRADVVAALSKDLGVSFDRHGTAMRRAVKWLAGSGGWHLSLSSNPLEALPLVDEAFRLLEAAPPSR